MNFKTIIIITSVSIVIGVGIFLITQKSSGIAAPAFQSSNQTKGISVSASPTSSPLPTWEPVSKNSNLSKEAEKIEIPSYTEDFKNLKSEVSQF